METTLCESGEYEGMESFHLSSRAVRIQFLVGALAGIAWQLDEAAWNDGLAQVGRLEQTPPEEVIAAFSSRTGIPVGPPKS